MKNKFLNVGLVCLFVGILMVSIFIPVTAQEATPSPTEPISEGPLNSIAAGTLSDYSLTFLQLDESDKVLLGPYDSMRVRFGIPNDWGLVTGTNLQLTLTSKLDNYKNSLDQTDVFRGATLQVFFNDSVIGTIFLDWNETQTFTFEIPSYALLPTRSDGRHELYLFMDASIDCENDEQTAVIVHSSSQFNFSYIQKQPTVDLDALPRPFYQSDNIFPTETYIVIPEAPTSSELRSAMIVAAGLSRMSYGNLPLSLITINELSENNYTQNNLVFVGTSPKLNILSDFELPIPLQNGSLVSNQLSENDGVIEMIISPWNTSKACLLISGQTDLGVEKAAQALSTGILREHTFPNFAIISEVTSFSASEIIPDDRTLQELGFETQVINQYGISTIDIPFYLPIGQTVTSGAYLDLNFTHSALIDYERSAVLISINDQPVRSIRLSEDTTQYSTMHIQIPDIAFRPGFNILSISTDLVQMNMCTDINFNGLWAIIADNSILHLPLIPSERKESSVYDISVFPDPFINSPSLSSTAFILPEDSPSSWKTAVDIAVFFGQKSAGSIINIPLIFSNEFDEAYQDFDLIIIGKGNDLPLLDQINNTLPAPFENGNNYAIERGFPVTYKIPEDISLGYLEWINSPWNENRIIMIIAGSSDQGLVNAGKALTVSSLRGQLAGNLVIIRDQKLYTTDTRINKGSNITSTALPDVDLPIVDNSQIKLEQNETKIYRPTWLLPAIIITSTITLATIAFAIYKSMKKS
jgi:hypothetical protein